jgi:phage-related protein
MAVDLTNIQVYPYKAPVSGSVKLNRFVTRYGGGNYAQQTQKGINQSTDSWEPTFIFTNKVALDNFVWQMENLGATFIIWTPPVTATPRRYMLLDFNIDVETWSYGEVTLKLERWYGN